MIDFVLTDALDCTAKPCAAVADYKIASTQIKFKIPELVLRERGAWHFSNADCERMVTNIEEANWNYYQQHCFGSSTTIN